MQLPIFIENDISWTCVLQLTDVLSDVPDPLNQPTALERMAQITPEDVCDRKEICHHIDKTFHQNHIRCQLYPFGSSLNGLGFRGCDLDLYLQTGLPHPRNVYETARILRTIPYLSHIQSIVSARVPIVKFIHKATGIACDISFRNGMSNLNTEFIAIGVRTDPRIRPMFMTLRYWGKYYDLTGGGGMARITNYAFTMLMFFYLQDIGLFHPVRVWQEARTPEQCNP